MDRLPNGADCDCCCCDEFSIPCPFPAEWEITVYPALHLMMCERHKVMFEERDANQITH